MPTLCAACGILGAGFGSRRRARGEAADAPSKLEQGLTALEASDYDLAEKSLRAVPQGKDRGAAIVGIARVELATGRYAEATKTAAGAEADRAVRAEATRFAAKLSRVRARSAKQSRCSSR